MTETIWQPQPGPQEVLVNCPLAEIFYGGARGGGKTDGMIGKNAIKAAQYGKYQKGIFFRRELPQLEMAIERCQEIYGPLGWKWKDQKKTFVAPNGATLKFRPLERDSDAEKYQGHDYTDLYFEELTNYPDPKPVNRLRATLRSANGVPCQFHATGNPGGPGHHWVKARYIDPNPQGMEVLTETLKNGQIHQRIFIPAKLEDNQILMEKDPNYESNLYLSGSEELVRAWREGDWNQVEGAFFDCWSQKLILQPFAIPEDWLKFRSFDWGYAKPFSVGWWAVVGDDLMVRGQMLRRGALICYREYYGCEKPDVGLRMDAEQVRNEILLREDEKITYSVADPAIFAEDGGPSIAERMRPIYWKPADNKRVSRAGHAGGWDQMRSRMRNDMIFWFSTCLGALRTIPALQHDANRVEDLDTNSEDHCFTADTLVRTSRGTYNFHDLPPVGEVLSDDGQWHSYRSVRLVKRQQPIVRLTFNDGSEVRCTPDHKFKTVNGWQPASRLCGLSLARFRNFSEQGTTCAGLTTSTRASDSTERFGNTITDPYRKECTSTTSTAAAAMVSAIYRCCRQICTKAFTALNVLMNPENIWTKSGTRQQHGTNLLLADNGTVTITSRLLTNYTNESASLAVTAGQWLNLTIPESSAPTNASRLFGGPAGGTMKSASVGYAVRNLQSTATQRPRTAPANVVQKQAPEQELVCLSVNDAGIADVYCLTVPDTGNFTLANNAIVANCADQTRYACMSRPWIPDQIIEQVETDVWGRRKTTANSWKIQ